MLDLVRPNAYLARWSNGTKYIYPGTEAAYHRLIKSVVSVPDYTVPLRRPSICHDGTPIIFSAALDRSTRSPLRLLVEPGGIGIDVPTQIASALSVLDGVLTELNWNAAAEQVNVITALVFPQSFSETQDWWGGVWLGLVSGEEALQVRVYLNFRWGDDQARWQRAIDVICAFSTEEMTPALRDLYCRTAAVGVPVGMGFGISDGAVRVLRLYLGVHRPSLAALSDALPPPFASSPHGVELLCRLYASRFGDFGPQTFTLGYDFLLHSRGCCLPHVARVKLDLCCHVLDDDQRNEVNALVVDLVRELDLDVTAFRRFQSDLDVVFGGSLVEFLSLSLRRPEPSLTLYSKPLHFASSPSG